jgi:enoyl-CoA hydratase/carnithine racemase
VFHVTFDYPPVNVKGQAMLADLNSLAMRLERDRKTKVVVFQSTHPESWVCHYDNLPSYDNPRSTTVPSAE